MLSLRHLPGLFIASTQTFGGLVPLFSAPWAEWAITAYGLPHIATSQPAQTMMIVSSARMTALGLAIFAFHFQGRYEAVDTMMVTLGWVGLIDGYVSWMEGVKGRVAFRWIAGAVIAAMGWYGLHTGG